ncbi:MAG: M48 family metalloprotease [Cyanobacteria bacterium J06641_5]
MFPRLEGEDVTQPLVQLPPLKKIATLRSSSPQTMTRPPRDRPQTAEVTGETGLLSQPERPAQISTSNPDSDDDLLLQRGHQAVLRKRYAEAIRDLEAFGKGGFDVNSPKHQYALMALVKAYRGNRQIEDAVTACCQLTACTDATVQTWVDETLSSLYSAQAKQARYSLNRDSSDSVPPRQGVYPFPKAGRAPGASQLKSPRGLPKLLPIALGTLAVLYFLPTLCAVAIALFCFDAASPDAPSTIIFGGICVGIAVFLAGVLFLSPWLIDGEIGLISRLRWSNWPGLEAYSKEAAEVLRSLSQQHNVSQPKLGVVDSPFPFIATYGALPGMARIVASKGLFSLLDESELATIYAREFSHIVRGDFAIVTLGVLGSQLCHRLYCWGRDWGRPKTEDEDERRAIAAARSGLVGLAHGVFTLVARSISWLFYGLQAAANAVLWPLGRARTYHADYFAASATGNPNSIARSVFKLAYGLTEVETRTGRPSPLFGGSIGFSPLAPQTIATAGGAYRNASEPQQVGRLLLWDIFSPWATWVEFWSSHPLLGRRLRVLGTYAKQLSLPLEFELETLLQQEAELADRRKLQQPFYIQWPLFYAPLLLAGVGGLGVAIATWFLNLPRGEVLVLGAVCLGFAVGTLLRRIAIFPGAARMPLATISALSAEPYLSPLRGRLTRLQGKLVGRADRRHSPSWTLQLQDTTGGVELRYSPRFGALGNLLRPTERLQALMGEPVTVSGWFRRSDRPWLEIDKIELRRGIKQPVKGHPRFWAGVQVAVSLLMGLGLLQLRLLLLGSAA